MRIPMASYRHTPCFSYIMVRVALSYQVINLSGDSHARPWKVQTKLDD